MKIRDDVLAVLDGAECDGPHLRITAQLERKLYVDVNKVLEAAGGKWTRKVKAHVFDGDAADAIEQVILTGEIATHQEFGFFETPPDVVDRLIELGDIAPGDTVLEPSAGRGAIALPLMRDYRCTVRCVELLPGNVGYLQGFGLPVVEGDFLETDLDSFDVPHFDRVVMNPPFARQADIDHVIHALSFLGENGRLVSVMSAGVLFRQNRKTATFRDFVADSGGNFERLPEDSFKPSGTLVQTAIVTIPWCARSSSTI